MVHLSTKNNSLSLDFHLQNLVNQANEKVDSSNISTTPKTKKSTTAEHENEQQRSSLPDITNSKRDQCELENYGNSLSKTNSYEGTKRTKRTMQHQFVYF